MIVDMLTSRRLWGGLLAIGGALSGAAVVPVESTETMVTAIVTVVGGLLSIASKFFPKS